MNVKVIKYGHRWAVINTARKDEPVILSLHGSEEEARKEQGRLLTERCTYVTPFWRA